MHGQPSITQRQRSSDTAGMLGVQHVVDHTQEIGQPVEQPVPSSGNTVAAQIGLDCIGSNEPSNHWLSLQ